MAENPIFTPLNRDRSEIRLLKVLPPSADGTPSFQFRIVSLDDNPTFACISYVWGDPAEIRIVLDGHAARISVGQVLPAIQTAIHHYQEIRDCDSKSLWLWTDALCINQSDEDDKSYQVPLMARIYSRAEYVIGCISTSMLSEESFRKTAEAVNEFERRLRNADLVGSDKNLIALPPFDIRIIKWVEGFDGLLETLEGLGNVFILDVTYWKRIWILQEISLASNAIIARDRDRFDWWKLKLVSRWRTKVVRLPKPDFVSEQSWTTITSNNATVFWDLIEVFAGSELSDINKSARRGPASFDGMQGQPESGAATNIISNDQQRRLKLQDWLTSFRSSSSLRATNPKDHIYGLLAIAPIAIKVDYSQSLRDVYSSYVAAYLGDWNKHFREELPQLHFLGYCGRSRHWVGSSLVHLKESYLPSWVPNYPVFCRVNLSFFGFAANLAPFGYPSSSYKDIFPPETEPARVLIDAGISRLFVSGIVLEAFSFTSLSASRGKKMLDIVSGINLLNKNVPAVSVLVQTIMWEKLQQEADHDVRDLHMAQWIDSCASMLREDIAERHSDPSMAEQKVTTLDLDACKSDNGLPAEYFRHELFLHRGIQAGNRLFLSESGWLCLVSPSRVQEGDILCILDGGSMPSILRPQGPYYIHICQAFVVGLENGQAIEYLRRGETRIQQFELI